MSNNRLLSLTIKPKDLDELMENHQQFKKGNFQQLGVYGKLNIYKGLKLILSEFYIIFFIEKCEICEKQQKQWVKR